MKIGLKIWADKLDLMDKFGDLFDFFEILAEPNLDIKLLKDYNFPIMMHVAHSMFGFNPSDKKKLGLNKQLLTKAIEAADAVDSRWIVVHPGYGLNPDAKEVMLSFYDDNFDKRFIFENCPTPDLSYNGHIYHFSIPSEMRQLLKRFNAGMVLDFGHATATANNLGKDPKVMIQEFFELNPKYFHLSGVDSDSKKDMHKHLFEVDNDFDFLKQIKKGKFVAFETGVEGIRDRKMHEKDIEVVRQIVDLH